MIIIGLGNPGEKYKNTRHNIGFMVLDSIRLSGLFSDWKNDKKLNAIVSKGEVDGKKIILVKPQTFMNRSGEAVKKTIKKYNLSNENMLVVHDDIDLPLGEIKISKNSGSAGHRGVESIIKNLKTKEFIRIRIGICPLRGKPKNVEEFVLKKFGKTEKIEEIIKRAIEIISSNV